MRAVTDSAGRIVVLFLMIGEADSGQSMTRSTAAAVLQCVISARLPPLLLDRRYPILDENGLPFEFAAAEPAADAGE
jgi:hypothetical protein